MYILGLNIGHNASAALLKDGKIVGCIEEERFTRQKGHSGVPMESVSYLLQDNKITTEDIDLVVSDGYNHPKPQDNDFSQFYLDMYTKKSLSRKAFSRFGYKFPRTHTKLAKAKWAVLKKIRRQRLDAKKKLIAKALNIPEQKITSIKHTTAHAYSTCFNTSENKKTLIFTLDGESEEGLCACVHVFDGEKLTQLAKSKKAASLGYLYSNATIHMGLKPGQHEFKVMGLAPYAKKDHVDKLYKKFEKLIWVNDKLEFESKFDFVFSDHFFKNEMKHKRFDTIAGAIQRLVEERACEWVEKTIKQTGIQDIALAGGVFLNVKASKKIAEIDAVKSIFVMPSCGDESVCIGDCFYGYLHYCQKNNIPFKPEPIKDLYLGPSYGDEYIQKFIQRENLNKKYDIQKPRNINLAIAQLLARGKIVARCTGRSEWGARSLGNRAILANAAHKDTVRILNEAIKDRDFWMPFTPSILDSYESKYIVNPKHIPAPYMCISFSSKEQARKDIPAALHPYDFTVRPQIVTKDYNKDYYEIIQHFARLTGAGGILNTSFNLHGEPNVLRPEEAIRTLENSGLTYLAMGNYLFKKK